MMIHKKRRPSSAHDQNDWLGYPVLQLHWTVRMSVAEVGRSKVEGTKGCVDKNRIAIL